MFNGRLFHLIKKEFIQIRRDRRMLLMALMIPVIQLIIFGYVVSFDVKHIALGSFNQDNRYFSRLLISRLEENEYFDLKVSIRQAAEIAPLLDSGRIKVAVNFPPDFSRKINSRQAASLQTLVDGSDANTASISASYLEGIVGKFNSDLLSSYLGPAAEKAPRLAAQPRVWFNQDLKTLNFMVPGLIALVLFMISAQLTSMAVVREREKGTIEQLLVSPVRPWEILAAKTIPFIVIGFFHVIFVTLLGSFWFKVPLLGSFWLLLGLSGIFLLNSLGIGLLVSTISQNQQQSMLTLSMFMFPAMLLSGFVFPIANMPLIFQWLTYIIPMRYFLVIVRGIFLKGVGLKYLWGQVWPLLVLGSFIFLLAVSRFRKKLQ